MKDCIFCKIVKGEAPATKLYEDDEVLVFKDIRPSAPVHDLIIPKKHVERLIDVQKEDINLIEKIVLVSQEVAKKEGIGDAFKLVTNNGKFAGQVVMHLHFHVVGGWKKKEDVKSELKPEMG